jgi:hypothetical protein
MKQLTFLLILVLILSTLNAQIPNIEIGKLYMIYLKNGNKVKARVTSITERQITCNLNDGPYPATYERSDIIRVESVHYTTSGSIGAGIGVAYGVIGINGEITLFKYLALSAGFGTTIYAGGAYSVGGRAYFAPAGAKWRPRISAHYGTNAIISVTGGQEIAEKFEGMTLGIGILGMLGENRRSGFDFEVVYLVSRGNFDERWNQIQNSGVQLSNSEFATGRIKILIGYRIAF